MAKACTCPADKVIDSVCVLSKKKKKQVRCKNGDNAWITGCICPVDKISQKSPSRGVCVLGKKKKCKNGDNAWKTGCICPVDKIGKAYRNRGICMLK
jgi:hypothetical protein